jgi:hypothetical protein
MNNFNKVFYAAKSYCNDPIKHPDCVKFISEKTGIPCDNVEPYLNTLHHLGFIRYSPVYKTIYLTNSGRRQEKLFL